MFNSAAILVLESSLNRLIASDSVTQLALAKLSGKIIEFNVTDTAITLYLLPHSSGMQLQNYCDHSDTQLCGTLHNFTALASSEDSTEHFFGNGINISGDTQLAAKFQRIIANAQIDWQGLIANISNDLVAAQLASLFNATKKQYSLTKQSLELNVIEYLQEEARTLPTSVEVDYFITQINDTRSAVDRLEARLNLMIQERAIAKTNR
ncbi:MAG: SCP2 sterol-binding domain-containing protein [Oceanospirillaceae bacterium]|nr:SCP2 sterol-binding domain-containing protein [Oceanospirillaceae bacterium]